MTTMIKVAANSEEEKGFTLIEVMIAILVFMVALLGLIALQKVSISGANQGREHTAAANVARFVVSAIRNEASSLDFSTNDTSLSSQDYPYLQQGLSDFSWHLLPNNDGNPVGTNLRLDAYLGNSNMSQYTGGGAVDTAPYCVLYRIRKLTTESGVFVEGLYMANVRVLWPRWGQYRTNWDNCQSKIGQNLTDLVGDWEMLEYSSVVSREYASTWSSN